MRNLIIAAIVAVAGLVMSVLPRPAFADSIASLPYTQLGVYTSEPGESLEAFVLRIRPVLVDYSKSTGFEACGGIAANADKSQFGIVLGTNLSHLGCAIYPDRVPEGLSYAGLTFHSHGLDRMYSMNRPDKIFTHNTAATTAIRVGGDNLFGFSETDFASGPGYLATPKGVLFQHGQGTTVDVTAPNQLAAK